MELAINLSHLLSRRQEKPQRSFEETLMLIKNAGFCHIDYMPDFISENWQVKAKEKRENLDKNGISVEQSHAPFNRYKNYPDSDFKDYFHRSFENAVIIGAKYIVVHADEYRSTERYDQREIEDFTYDYIAPELEFAKKHGLSVAIENLFEDTPTGLKSFDGKSRFTSRVEELIGLIERFNDPNVVCCWDFGHAAASYGYDNQLNALKQAIKYVKCTHVHDNNQRRDLHMLPFTGITDWESHMKLLREFGYADNGDKFTFEFVYDNFPDELMQSWLGFTKEVGDTLVSMYEN